MKSQEINDVILKIKTMTNYLQFNKITGSEINQFSQILTKLIDQYLLEKNEIINLLFEYENKVHQRDLKMYISVNKAIEFDIRLVNQLLSAFKNNLALLLENDQSFFDLYIYSEIKNVLKYYLHQTISTNNNDNFDQLYMMQEKKYHSQVAIYKYLFSMFDKFLYINLFVTNKFALNQLEENDNYHFLQDFVCISQPLFINQSSAQQMEQLCQKLQKSSAFHFVRKLRNNLEHNFANPEIKTNLTLATQLLFILIMRVILEINFDFKNDQEIYHLLAKK